MKKKNEYTRYEKTRIVSSRSLQIAQGSPILIKVSKNVIDPTEIAKLEWEAGVIPIDIMQKAKVDIKKKEQAAKPDKEKKEAKAAKPAKKKK
jgi:DNA-directed RNA polymerase subunit K